MASLTLAKLRERVDANVGTKSATTGEDDQTLVTDDINEAYEDILVKTKCKVRRVEMDFTGEEQEYSLPTEALAIIEVYSSSDSEAHMMERQTIQQMIRHRRSEVGSPAKFYCVLGSDYLEVWPPPAAGDTITTYYVPRPAPLTDAAHIPSDVPAEFHQGLEFYASWRAAMRDEQKASSFGAVYKGLYNELISDIKKANKVKGGVRFGRAWIGQRNRHVRLNNSQYPR